MSRNVSTAARRALYASQSGEAFLILLEISHPDLAEPIRITSDMINTPHGQDFLATFTRASVATKIDGTQVASGAPRYEQGQYGQGIMLEEGTTNLLSGKVIATTHTRNGFAGWEITGISTDNPRKNIRSSAVTVLPSTEYVFSGYYWSTDAVLDDVYLRFNDAGWFGSGSTYLRPLEAEGGRSVVTITDLGSGFKRYAAKFTTNAATTSINEIFFDADTAGRVVFFGAPQLELGPAATSYIPSTRASEVAKIDRASSGLDGAAWTVEIDAQFIGTGRQGSVLDHNVFCYLSASGANGFGPETEYHLFRTPSGILGFYVPSGGTKSSAVTVADHVPVRLAWSYDAGQWALYINGSLAVQHAGIAINYSILSAYMLLASTELTASRHGNLLLSGLRISNRARTSSELLAGMGRELRIDEDTTAFLAFNSNLESNHLYVATPFQVTLPDDRDDQISRATLTVDNVDRRIVEAIRSMSGSPTVTMSIVMGSNPQQVEAGPFEFRLSGVGYDSLTVEGSLGYEEDFLNTSFPADDFTPQNTPGLFA